MSRNFSIRIFIVFNIFNTRPYLSEVVATMPDFGKSTGQGFRRGFEDRIPGVQGPYITISVPAIPGLAFRRRYSPAGNAVPAREVINSTGALMPGFGEGASPPGMVISHPRPNALLSAAQSTSADSCDAAAWSCSA